MNKQVLSTSLSLACHTIFLIIAFNMLFTPSSDSEPIAPPLLIHVHLDARPFSPSMGNNGQKMLQKNLPMAPEMKIVRVPTPKKRHHHSSQTVMNTPIPAHKPIISNDHVITVEKENAPALHAPTQRDTHKTLFNAQEVFKDMVIANRQMATSPTMPVSDVSNQIQQLQTKPSMESEVQDYQGATPYLPFDHNGSGTDIKTFLGYDLYTYEDPSDHVKYFKLSIKVEDIPGSLAPLPKEITFLVDASASIGPDLLEQFKTGVEKSLDELGSNDNFNVIVFNDVIHKMQDQPVSNSLANIKQANDFLTDFQSTSETDLYDTVLKCVKSHHTMKPSYIYLISDGQPTQGVTDSMQLINQISAVDRGRVPIFGLGAGWSNEYLMNFLTFTNHGWAEFVPLNTVNSITQMYDHIKDPVLLNLRYHSIGLNENEIYPKELPDLFKGAEFVLYGRYTTEGNFMFQLRGDTRNDIKQYIIKDNLNNGHEGDRTIAEEWAMRKIYNLIGQLQYNHNNQGIIDEVNQLASQFNLKIPEYKINK